MPEHDASDNIAALLAAVREGDEAASARLFTLVYDELHRIASGYMRRERKDHTLQPTAVVHEAYLRLMASVRGGATFENESHFVATAAVAMRRILVDHAKTRKAAKRGGEMPALQLGAGAAEFEERAIDLLALDEALDRLEEHNPLQARLVVLRFFGGMSFERCAEALGVSERALYYEWAHARAWLRSRLLDR